MSAARDEYLEEMAEATERGYRLEDDERELELEAHAARREASWARARALLTLDADGCYPARPDYNDGFSRHE
jgi:hypothetical protein